VTPVLILERRPADDRWPGLAAELGIVLTYSPDFPGL